MEGGQVFTFGPAGLLRALETSTGRLLWSRQAAEENGGKPPQWGYAGSPLLVGKVVVVSVGGPGGRSLVAYDRTSGEKAWSGGDDRAAFASPQLFTLAGRQQIVIFNEASVAGHDPETGKLLWSFPWSSAQANVAQPLDLGGDQLLISSGYGVGASAIEIVQDGGGWAARERWHSNQMKAKFTNLVATGGKVYGLDDGIFACIDAKTGEKCWKAGRYGHGQILLAGELILLLSESGEMVLIEPDPAGLKELGRFPALSGKSWNTFALSGSKLLVRNHQEAACFELPLVPKQRLAASVARGAQQEDRNLHRVADLVGGRAEDQVGQEAVAVGAHGDQVGAALLGELDDLVGGLAAQEGGVGGDAGAFEALAHLFEVGAVDPHLLGFGQVELVEMAGHPAVGHVHQQHPAAELLGQRLDVGEDRFVGAAVLEGHQDQLVHQRSPR